MFLRAGSNKGQGTKVCGTCWKVIEQNQPETGNPVRLWNWKCSTTAHYGDRAADAERSVFPVRSRDGIPIFRVPAATHSDAVENSLLPLPPSRSWRALTDGLGNAIGDPCRAPVANEKTERSLAVWRPPNGVGISCPDAIPEGQKLFSWHTKRGGGSQLFGGGAYPLIWRLFLFPSAQACKNNAPSWTIPRSTRMRPIRPVPTLGAKSQNCPN